MILVDAGVWIDYFRGVQTSKVALHFLRAVVSSCSIVTEILIPSPSILALFLHWQMNSFAGITCVTVKSFFFINRARYYQAALIINHPAHPTVLPVPPSYKPCCVWPGRTFQIQ